MCLPDCLKVVPPVMSIVKEALNCLRLELFLKACLTFDDLLSEKFLSGQCGYQVDVHSKHTQRSLVS